MKCLKKTKNLFKTTARCTQQPPFRQMRQAMPPVVCIGFFVPRQNRNRHSYSKKHFPSHSTSTQPSVRSGSLFQIVWKYPEADLSQHWKKKVSPVPAEKVPVQCQASRMLLKVCFQEIQENLTHAELRPQSSVRSVSAQVFVRFLTPLLHLPENHYKYFFLRSVRTPVCTKLKQVS